MKFVHTNLLKKLPADRRVLATVGIFHQTCLFTNNTISHNVLVGIHVEFTTVDFHGDSFIVGNNVVGGFGGGIRLYHGGNMNLWHDGTLNIANNSADYGGGIHVDHMFILRTKSCFFDFGTQVPTVEQLIGPKRVKLWNNKAKFAGNSIYGGYIDNCTTTSPIEGLPPGFPGIDAFPLKFLRITH